MLSREEAHCMLPPRRSRDSSIEEAERVEVDYMVLAGASQALLRGGESCGGGEVGR